MQDATDLVVSVDVQAQAITTAAPLSPLDLAIVAWLDAKFKHTHSMRTLGTYRDILLQFRAALQRAGLDLDMLHTQADRDQVKQIAQAFASFSARGRAVALATINNRYAVLSSFYADCIKHERAGITYNPIEHLDRAKAEPFAGVQALDFEQIAAAFEKMDMHKPEDVRDSALLMILLETGHRATVVAGLQWRHVTIRRNVVTLFFERCKGNKSAHVELSKEASAALLRWLHLHYGRDLARLPGESPLWVSLARNESHGQALSIQAIGQICLKRLGTSKVHTMRHTFTMGMLESGASVQEVSSKLLHSSLQTTSIYVDKLQSAKNKRAGKLAQLFGFK